MHACEMEGRPCPSPAMAARWLLLLLLAGLLPVHGAQVDDFGFITIDCGLPESAVGWVDNVTTLSFVSDAGFIDTGTNYNLSAEYISPSLGRGWHNVRSFGGAGVSGRNCYTLPSLVSGSGSGSGLKYLIQAYFMYGNYDGLNRPPVFDLHVGVNYWTTVNLTVVDIPVLYETITVVPGGSVDVCLVNTGSGTPFISGLGLRPLKTGLYPMANATQGLVLLSRANLGPTDLSTVIRFPDDPHDRIWFPEKRPTEWSEITTTKKVENFDGNKFEAPSAVMQTAVTPINASRPIVYSWDAQPSAKNPAPGYICILHMSELELLKPGAARQFYITTNGLNLLGKGFTPEYLYSDAVFNTNAYHGFHQYNVSLEATANSTLRPILNAVEVFSVVPTTGVPTATQDVSAITVIRSKYQVKMNWMGDPCVPKNFAWNGLGCSYAISTPPSITGLNLSSSGLSGNLLSSFADLKGLQYLDISGNNLTGSIPVTFSQLSSLALLDVTGNQLSGSIPSGLLKRMQDGSLILRYGSNPNLCSNGDSCQPPKKKKSSNVAVYVALAIVAVLVIVLLSVLLLCMLRRRQGTTPRESVRLPNKPSIESSHFQVSNRPSSLRLDNRRFTYAELEAVTGGFQREIGEGGFGKVYSGSLEDGTLVAVKLLSESSKQGVREFLAEAQTLAKIHHKNLVSLIGYCKDREYMALVYEYMSEGALHAHLRGRGSHSRCLTWRQRLRIALESAQGLEYLHKGCNPPLIHRDVKTSNILLSANLEAKIADFGLLKVFNSGDDTHVSTARLIGTPGYISPEYRATLQLTNKSDVYSFGVVLLEIVTGKLPILNDPEPTSIMEWVQQRLTRGNIESVVDARMRSNHDVNSVWKAADIALKCTARSPEQRPTMSDVVMQLQECLELEAARGDGGFYSAGSGGNLDGYGGFYTDMSADMSQRNTAFDMRHLRRVPTISTGPDVR